MHILTMIVNVYIIYYRLRGWCPEEMKGRMVDLDGRVVAY